MNWWRKLWQNSADPPLTSVPVSGRPKTYLADSGHSYNYRFQGHRALTKNTEEYVFQVGTRTVSVIQDDAIFATWRSTHGRDLTSEERFGFAKMSLRSAMDNASTPAELPSRIVPAAADVETISSLLDL